MKVTQKQLDALETVLDMGLYIENDRQEVLKSNFGTPVIAKADWSEKEYPDLAAAVKRLLR